MARETKKEEQKQKRQKQAEKEEAWLQKFELEAQQSEQRKRRKRGRSGITQSKNARYNKIHQQDIDEADRGEKIPRTGTRQNDKANMERATRHQCKRRGKHSKQQPHKEKNAGHQTKNTRRKA